MSLLAASGGDTVKLFDMSKDTGYNGDKDIHKIPLGTDILISGNTALHMAARKGRVQVQRNWSEKCVDCTCLELSWPNHVINKWLNISARECAMTADRPLPSVSQKLHLLGSTMTQGVQQPQPYQKCFEYGSYSDDAFRYLTQQSTHLSMIVPKVSPVCV
ncbi:hypothetical protein Tco_0999337 [Tanacetum coccineum]